MQLRAIRSHRSAAHPTSPAGQRCILIRLKDAAAPASLPVASSAGSLEQNSNGVATVDWSNVVIAPIDEGTTKSVIIYPQAGNRFYRPFKP